MNGFEIPALKYNKASLITRNPRSACGWNTTTEKLYSYSFFVNKMKEKKRYSKTFNKQSFFCIESKDKNL